MRLESNPHAIDCAYCATRWSRSRHITTVAIHDSGSSTAGKFKLPGIACGNCRLQQPASMLHDVRVLCLLPQCCGTFEANALHSFGLHTNPEEV
ncbi:hypothetical protein KCU65_g5141, partial [Aureobasidium melanogenum]